MVKSTTSAVCQSAVDDGDRYRRRTHDGEIAFAVLERCGDTRTVRGGGERSLDTVFREEAFLDRDMDGDLVDVSGDDADGYGCHRVYRIGTPVVDRLGEISVVHVPLGE